MDVTFLVVEFFSQNFCYPGTFIYLGRIHTHLHTRRETGAMTIGKICKEDLPRNYYIIIIYNILRANNHLPTLILRR